MSFRCKTGKCNFTNIICHLYWWHGIRFQRVGGWNRLGDEIINSLLYADDIVLKAANEDDLQLLLRKLNSWCSKLSPEANMLKANVMHSCMLGTLNLRYLNLVSSLNAKKYCERYNNLGTTTNEHLNFTQSVQVLCASAERTLSGII